MWEKHFPPFPGPGTCKSPACKIVCNLPARTKINGSSNNLTSRIPVSNIDTLVPAPKSAKPRGWGHLKDRSEPLKHWEKIVHKQKMKCYSNPIWTDASLSIYTRCRHDLTMVKPPETWLWTCFLLLSGFFFSGRCFMFKKKLKGGKEVCLGWHGNYFLSDLCVRLMAWRERNNQGAVRSYIYNNPGYTPIMSQKNIRDQESDYWVNSCLKNIKNTQSKEFPEKCKTNFSQCCVLMRWWLWASSGVLGCSCSSALGSLPARSTLQDCGNYCWDDGMTPQPQLLHH